MMKKLLLTTALLGASAGMAMADVTISGTGRFGVVYQQDRTESIAGVATPANETLVSGRLRFNIDASTETDSGATFGGRIRMQYSIGDFTDFSDDGLPAVDPVAGNSGAQLSPAYLYVEYEGLRVEVGNSNTAFDSAALYYDSEIGFISSSYGNRSFDFYSFNSGPYGFGEKDRVGIYASYSVGDFTGQFSYVDGDQLSDPSTANEEVSIALAYETDLFTVSAAAVQDGAGILDNDQFFLGGAYNVNDAIRVGLLYTSTDDGLLAHEVGDTVTLFGSYTVGAIKVEGYVANNDDEANLSDTVYGIGADYDLGGATLSGSIQRSYSEDTYADLGVNFSF
jgi:outer membrane protein OmpU